MLTFRNWLESGIRKALFLVHPDFALDNWYLAKHLDSLKKYYSDVMRYVDGFDGDVLIHSFKPRHASDFDGSYGFTGRENILEYEKFAKWMLASKAKVVVEKASVCERPDDLFELIDNLDNDAEVYWGGGYLGSCLSRTLEFIQDFDKDTKKKNVRFIPVKHLIYIPGFRPATYDQIDPNEEERNRGIARNLEDLPPLFRKSVKDSGIDSEIGKHLGLSSDLRIK